MLKETALCSKQLPLSVVCSCHERKQGLDMYFFSPSTMTNSTLHDSILLRSVLDTSEYSPKMEILIFLS